MSRETPHTGEPLAPATGQDRFLLTIVAGTILLVVVAIVVVFLVGRGRTTPPADPNSPAGVVQLYVEAVRNGDLERARTYLTREARARQNTNFPARNDNVRIVVQTVSSTDTMAEVKVTISRFHARSNPFSSSTSHYDTTIRLIREDGTWHMTQPIEPYTFS